MRRITTVAAIIAMWLVIGCNENSRAIDKPKSTTNAVAKELAGMQIGYLEFVTPSVDNFCSTYEKIHGVTFSEPMPQLGNARIAQLDSGGNVGVRAPMRPDESPVVRPYFLTDDIHAAFKAAEGAGATLAHPPMEIPGHGTFAIFIHDGIESALWQNLPSSE